MLYVIISITVVGLIVLYQVAGPYYEVGIASWYGPGFHGNYTANGEVYDMYGISAAHKTLPFVTIVRVVEIETGRSIVVRINDRGPFIDGRIIDLSKGAAEKPGLLKKESPRWGCGSCTGPKAS